MRDARLKAIREGRAVVPSRKGIPNSEEQKRKISATLTGRKNTWGDKIGSALKGKAKSAEHKKSLSEMKKGQFDKGLLPHIGTLGQDNHQWKGDKVGYYALHNWVKRRLKKPEICEFCNEVKKLDLANKTGEYKRDLSDWIWLCRKCHQNYDRENSIYKKAEWRK